LSVAAIPRRGGIGNRKVMDMSKGKGSGGSAQTVNKSAVDGRFVSDRKVQSSPSTTYKQTVKK